MILKYVFVVVNIVQLLYSQDIDKREIFLQIALDLMTPFGDIDLGQY